MPDNNRREMALFFLVFPFANLFNGDMLLPQFLVAVFAIVRYGKPDREILRESLQVPDEVAEDHANNLSKLSHLLNPFWHLSSQAVCPYAQQRYHVPYGSCSAVRCLHTSFSVILHITPFAVAAILPAITGCSAPVPLTRSPPQRHQKTVTDSSSDRDT